MLNKRKIDLIKKLLSYKNFLVAKRLLKPFRLSADRIFKSLIFLKKAWDGESMELDEHTEKESTSSKRKKIILMIIVIVSLMLSAFALTDDYLGHEILVYLGLKEEQKYVLVPKRTKPKTKSSVSKPEKNNELNESNIFVSQDSQHFPDSGVSNQPENNKSNQYVGIKNTNKKQARHFSYLPPLLFFEKEAGNIINEAERERLTQQFASKYLWQRYKAIIDLDKKNYMGAETLFVQALSEKKLWIRLRALIGLSGLGVMVPQYELENIVYSQSPKLFMNFVKKYTGTKDFDALRVFLQALPLIDTPTRYLIVKIMSGFKNKTLYPYFIAAIFDSNKGIRNLAQSYLKQNKLTQKEIKTLENHYLNVIQDKLDVQVFLKRVSEIVD